MKGIIRDYSGEHWNSEFVLFGLYNSQPAIEDALVVEGVFWIPPDIDSLTNSRRFTCVFW